VLGNQCLEAISYYFFNDRRSNAEVASLLNINACHSPPLSIISESFSHFSLLLELHFNKAAVTFLASDAIGELDLNKSS